MDTMGRSIRIAFATDTGELIDGHFGGCKAFVIYDLKPAVVEFITARSTVDADEAEDRNKARAELIGDCQIACFQSIGGPAAAKAVRAGVHPMKVVPNTRIDDMLLRLQGALQHPPPWLAKVMGVEAASLIPYRELVGVEEE